MSALSDALARLARYRGMFPDGHMIDAEVGLSTNDLDVIITVTGTAALDPGVASAPTASDVADKPPLSEPITASSDRPLAPDPS